MKNIFFTIALALSLFSSEYVVDKEYSTIKFDASKMLFIGVSGEFSNFSGTITVDEQNKLSKIDAVVSIDSINTEDQERDDNLKSDDYFHALKFPNIEFSSTNIIDDTVKATVTIKGITKELSFKISDIEVSSNNLSFTLTSVVDRQQFMLNGSMSAIMSDNIDVTAKIIANKQ